MFDNTADRDKRMFEMIEAGVPRRQIAAEIGLSLKTMKRRACLLRSKKYHPKRVHGKRGTAAEAAEKQRVIEEMHDACASPEEICAAVGLAMLTITKRLRALESHASSEDEPPRGDHAGFLELLSEAHAQGAGEIPGIAGRGHFARISAASPHSGVGSLALLCAGN